MITEKKFPVNDTVTRYTCDICQDHSSTRNLIARHIVARHMHAKDVHGTEDPFHWHWSYLVPCATPEQYGVLVEAHHGGYRKPPWLGAGWYVVRTRPSPYHRDETEHEVTPLRDIILKTEELIAETMGLLADMKHKNEESLT